VSPIRRARNEAGFTVLEIIAALAILSVSFSVLFNLLSDGLQRTSQTEKMAEATLLAQSLLARVGTELPIRPGLVDGEFEQGYHWRLAIEPFGDPNDRRAWPVGAHVVTAKITWNDGGPQTVQLTTIRLGPKEPAS